MGSIIDYRKASIVILIFISVGIAGLYYLLNNLESDSISFQPDPLLATIISVSTGVYISLIVLIYSKKQYKARQQFLKSQIIDNLKLLNESFGIDIQYRQRNSNLTKAKNTFINESLLNQKKFNCSSYFRLQCGNGK